MNQEQRLPRNAGSIVGVLIVGLIVGGGITVLFLYPIATSDRTSFYIALAAILLAPIFLLAAFVINVKKASNR
jgi:NADH:ubiquinone oxidoreductase subunit 3 (subunit A)